MANYCGSRLKTCPTCKHRYIGRKHSDSEYHLDNCPDCGASRFCERKAMANGRCYVHGGNSPPAGLDHPRVTTGAYVNPSNDLGKLGERLAAQLDNPNYLSVQEEIAVLRTRMLELLEHIGSLDNKTFAYELALSGTDKVEWGLINAGNAAASSMMIEGVQEMRRALERVAAENEAWREVRALVGSINSTVGQDISRLKTARAYISNADLVILFNHVQRVVLENVPEQDRRVRIKQGLNEVLEMGG